MVCAFCGEPLHDDPARDTPVHWPTRSAWCKQRIHSALNRCTDDKDADA